MKLIYITIHLHRINERFNRDTYDQHKAIGNFARAHTTSVDPTPNLATYMDYKLS